MILRYPALGVSKKVLQTPVELRDILPTFLDAAGVAPARQIDGSSLLACVRNNGAGWREYIDLEHDVCYAPENHWNALTDGRMKYIFHARDGEEQLFDLARDPQELHDLAPESEHTAELRRWRSRLIEHLAERGAPFVTAGKLGLRPERMLYSPLYPKTPA
jgi:arylsulfatase A-like enzyme